MGMRRRCESRSIARSGSSQGRHSRSPLCNRCSGSTGRSTRRSMRGRYGRRSPTSGRIPNILAITGEPGLGHPMVRALGGTWVSRQQGLWVAGYLHVIRQGGALDPQTETVLDRHAARERAMLIEDIDNSPPTVVLVDNFFGSLERMAAGAFRYRRSAARLSVGYDHRRHPGPGQTEVESGNAFDAVVAADSINNIAANFGPNPLCFGLNSCSVLQRGLGDELPKTIK